MRVIFSFFFFFSPPSAFLQSLFCKIKTLPSPWVESGRLGLVHQCCKLFITCVVGSVLYGSERKVKAPIPTPKTERGRAKGHETDANSAAAWCKPFYCYRVTGIRPSRQNIHEYPRQNAMVLDVAPQAVPSCDTSHSDASQCSAQASLPRDPFSTAANEVVFKFSPFSASNPSQTHCSVCGPCEHQMSVLK